MPGRGRGVSLAGGVELLLRAALLVLVGSVVFAEARAQDGAAASVVAPAKAAAPAYTSEPKFVAAMDEGKLLKARGQFGFAADAFKKANKIAGGQCEACLMAAYQAELSARNYKDAAAMAAGMEALTTTPRAKSAAEEQRARAMPWGAGEKPKPAQLEAVHALLQQALTDYPKNAAALYADGQVLARMGKLDEARGDFEQCVKCVSPGDPARLRAQHFAENPELSLHRMAPPFEVTALDGKRFNLDAMGGRVVLIDFWATWCGPCNAELPHLQKIASEFAGQALVMISVSWDADEAKWKEFIAKHEMTWVQYRDADHRLSGMFDVQAIPHYFTIDSDGVLTAEMLGQDSDVEGKLRKLLARAREANAGRASAENGMPGARPDTAVQ